MSPADNPISDAQAFSESEQQIVQTLIRYLRTIDNIDPQRLADRPCIDLSTGRLQSAGETVVRP